ncbi:MAG: hypothetical protein M0036_03030 [Desulfobacteraceae bacterium]|nr:hypothetical protein [Desulfobacteraceae bacterium]
MKRAITNMVLACFLVASIAAVAAANDPIAPSTEKPKASNNGVAYQSSGVGTNDRTQMDLMDARYNLKIIFHYPSGDYPSPINVKIKDEKGKVLIDADTKSLWFFAKLPAGQYLITTELDSQVWKRNITIGPHTRSLIEDWDLN